MEELNKNEVIEDTETVEIEEDISVETVNVSDEGFLSGLTAAQRRRRMIWDKFTTGILIALLASPIAILAYIFTWFIFR